MKTNAAVLYKPNTPLRVETIDLQPPRAGEILVKIAASGVCHSDWHVISGATHYPTPTVLGHEGSGIVQEIGEGVSRIREGDLVVFNWSPSCGSCFYCLNDRPNLCPTYLESLWAGHLLDGSTRLSKNRKPIYHLSGISCNAQYAVIPEICCVPLPKKIPFEVAALIGCAVTTGIGAAIYTAKIKPGTTVAVFGAGGVGLCIIMGAQLAGAGKVIAVDKTQGKLKLAREFGANHELISGANTNNAIRSLTSGRGADYVFDAVGMPSLQEECLDAVRPGGSLVLAGLAPMDSNTRFPSAVLTRQEKTIVGSYYGSANVHRDFPLFADLYLHGKLDLDRLITKTYSLEEINQAYNDMIDGKLARGLIVF
ncbi:MAG: Zn-dependent alcohol dehydrogenase [Anaerolineales bacterium]|jgi:Zn-dependent alcohol dehydrogenase